MRKFLLAVALLGILGLAFGGYWFWYAELLRTGLRDWRTARMAEGYRIEHAEPVVNGFPAALVARLQAPHIASPTGWRWHGDEALLEAAVFAPGQLSLTLRGRQELTMSAGGGGQRVDRFASNDASLTIDLAPDGAPLAGRGRIAGYRLAEGPRKLLSGASMTIDFHQLPTTGDGQSSSDFNASLRQVDLSRVIGEPLGGLLHALDLRGRLVAWPRAGETKGEPTPWNGYEGRIDIEHLDLRWPPVDLSASGAIGLDEQRRPAGRLDAWWRDLPALIDRLVTAGLVESQAAVPIKAAFMLLPRRKAADGRVERLLPIVLEDGRVFVGPIEIGRVTSLP
jgi:hypothetical protein